MKWFSVTEKLPADDLIVVVLWGLRIDTKGDLAWKHTFGKYSSAEKQWEAIGVVGPKVKAINVKFWCPLPEKYPTLKLE